MLHGNMTAADPLAGSGIPGYPDLRQDLKNFDENFADRWNDEPTYGGLGPMGAMASIGGASPAQLAIMGAAASLPVFLGFRSAARNFGGGDKSLAGDWRNLEPGESITNDLAQATVAGKNPGNTINEAFGYNYYGDGNNTSSSPGAYGPDSPYYDKYDGIWNPFDWFGMHDDPSFFR